MENLFTIHNKLRNLWYYSESTYIEEETQA